MAKTKFITDFCTAYTNAAGVASGSFCLYPAANNTTQACNRAVTVSGIRWMINGVTGNTSAGSCVYKWVVWVRRGGQTVAAQTVTNSTTVVATNGQAFPGINPNDVLIWGHGIGADGADMPGHFEGATKTQRKMNEGDALVFSWATWGGTIETGTISGMIQTFMKS